MPAITVPDSSAISSRQPSQSPSGIRAEDERARGEIEMVPGMPVQVFVKTGESTVALCALNPLLDTINRAFREN